MYMLVRNYTVTGLLDFTQPSASLYVAALMISAAATRVASECSLKRSFIRMFFKTFIYIKLYQDLGLAYVRILWLLALSPNSISAWQV